MSATSLTLTEQIGQLEKEEWVDLHGLIACATSRVKPSASCLAISLLGQGSYNTVYKLIFSDGDCLAASVSNNDEEDFNPQAKQSEVQTMKFVRDSGLYSDVPVPRVHAWDVTFTNPAKAPYVLMDVVPGTSVGNLQQLPHQQQMCIVKSLAKLQASLAQPVPFKEIGSITANAEGGYAVGPLMINTEHCLGGPYRSIQELWRSRLEHAILHAVQEWSSIEKDELSQSLSEPRCTPQKFAELIQLLSSLIPQFELPTAYLPLYLYHPDVALRNIIFETSSLSSGLPKITGLLDWGGAQILPLMLTAVYPDNLMSSGDDPFTRPGAPDERWRSVPCDWTSIGDPTQWPKIYRGPDDPVDLTPRAQEMVRRFYLRTYFSMCYAEELRAKYGDKDVRHATLFADAPYYLKFHETVCGGWARWVKHASWIRETYWRLRMCSTTGSGKESIVVGPNVYRGSVYTVVRDLGILESHF